jgi:NAD(P)H-hydrate epimerase
MAALAGGEPPPAGPAGDPGREVLARACAARWRATVVLKGTRTLIAAPGGALYRNTAGTRGLGTAGSGDALAGLVGGLLAQGLDAPAAAVWGVYLHARAGEAAADDLGHDGLLASDVVERLPRVLRALRGAAPAR